MSIETIEQSFKARISDKVRIASEGQNRYRVFTPFRFDDGDHLSIVLKQDDGKWMLSDEAHTYMHLTYDIEEQLLYSGTRQKIISNALSVFQVQDRDGELILGVQDEQYGDALYDFIQALLKISDVSYLTRERVHSTFMDDFNSLLSESVPEDRRKFDWHDPERDPKGIYTVDCRVNGMAKPLHVHALSNDANTRDATISILQFEKWNVPFRSLAIFEDQESINRKVLARLTDVCERQFSSISNNRDRIKRHIKDAIEAK